ncbi:MAG TPA: glycosyltransferase [Gemmatimonadales bacterium]|nr:glycosyltransferase [Gemmatimonadales bacterium]
MRVAGRHHRVRVLEQAANLTEDAPLVPAPGPEGSRVRVFRPADRSWRVETPRVRTSLRTILAAADSARLMVWIDSPRVMPLVPSDLAFPLICDLRDPMQAATATLARADLLLTSGSSAFQALRNLHPRTYLFPHAVDVEHFSRARNRHREPTDQAKIPGPRIGFWGTVDERIDFELLDALAVRMPQVQFVMLGPVERGGRERVVSHANVHWLGSRAYGDLPDYISGWSAALLPFVRNDSTRFTSPPQIPEFLAAGRTVVSTSVHDVLHPYGASGLVKVADSVEGIAAAIDAALRGQSAEWLTTVDRYLRALSWESTWEGIEHLMGRVLQQRSEAPAVAGRVSALATLTPVSVMH